MAQGEHGGGHGGHGQQWQDQANRFKAKLDEAEVVLADPNSTPEQIVEANITKTDMEANLARLLADHGVSPE